MGLYRLLGLLSEGGRGTVYQGLAPGGEPVAVKLLHARWPSLREVIASGGPMGGNVASVVTPEVALPLTAGVGLLAGWAARSTG
ncbi:hypothetical protein [Microbispora bryophytorum]|uniref:hypothetical protein n=1 Tax=Microbispora bryophytorum TaxID=1460882 RepID=UPI0033EDC4D9